MIYDPEEIGYMLNKIITEDIYLEEERTDDFQDIGLWRILVVKTAQELMNRYKKHLIVPMTIYKCENFDYILNGFRSFDRDTFHFCLLASEETIKKRVENRGDKFDDWYRKHTNAGVIAFKDIKFQEHIDTDNKEIEEVVRIILGKISKINL
jgi:hypothetical protein